MAEETPAERWQLVRGSNVQPSLRLTLYALHCFQGNGKTAFCSRETLADEIGVHVDHLSGKLKALEDLGVIQRIWTQRNGRPSREFIVDYQKLKTQQRPTLRNSSECESSTLRNSSVPPCEIPQPHLEESLSPLHIEDPENIQRTFTLGNSPNSLESSGRKSKAKSDGKLTAFCIEWNAWHSAGIVRQKIRDTNSPGKTIVDAWNRSQRDPEQRGRLRDLPGLRAAIASSQALLKPAAWFDAAGLIGGKNKNHRWYAEQLAAGTYRDRATHGASGNAEALEAWQKIHRAAKDHCGDAAGFERAIGPKLAGIVKALRLTRLAIDTANDFDRREQERKFIQAFSRQGAAA